MASSGLAGAGASGARCACRLAVRMKSAVDARRNHGMGVGKNMTAWFWDWGEAGDNSTMSIGRGVKPANAQSFNGLNNRGVDC